MGRTIDFGDVVQLKHVRSGNFLTVMKERAQMEPTAMSIQTIPFGNVYSQVVVLPGYKTSKLGEKITYGVAVSCLSLHPSGLISTRIGTNGKCSPGRRLPELNSR